MSQDAAWKQFERRIAARLEGRRRGADTSNESGGKTDIVAMDRGALPWGVECKLLSRAGHQDILEACRQAERNSSPEQTPVAIVKRKGDLDKDSLVSMRLETWLSWYGPSHVTDEPAHPPLVVRMPRTYCVNCGEALVARSCKLVCESDGCGYFMSCSDLEPAG